MHHAVSRMLRACRQREAREYMTSIWPHRDVVAYTWEQALWGDIIYTVAGGVPRMQISAEDRPEGWEDVALEGPPMVALLQRMQQQQLDLPESWWPVGACCRRALVAWWGTAL